MHEQLFPQLVDAHYASLYRFALSLTRRPAEAWDLTQQTFFIWASKGKALREIEKAKSWLFTTLYREFLRGRRADNRVSAIEELGASDCDLPTTDPDVASRIDAQAVIGALQDIDPRFREALALFYLQELSYFQIAEVLCVPIGTVTSRISRGKAQLRRRLAAISVDAPPDALRKSGARS